MDEHSGSDTPLEDHEDENEVDASVVALESELERKRVRERLALLDRKDREVDHATHAHTPNKYWREKQSRTSFCA